MTYHPQPTNQDDIVDSRDIIARIAELQAEKDTYTETQGTIGDSGDTPEPWDVAREDDAQELAILLKLQEECEGYSDWEYGVTLVRDSYFTDYCIELVQDIGDLPKDISGYLVIDWDKTADNLRQDYGSVEWQGVTYWVR